MTFSGERTKRWVAESNKGIVVRGGSFVIEGSRWHCSRVLAPHDNSAIEGCMK